jgi:hypothetical protein
MRQICNLVYFMLADGKTPPQIAELDTLLAGPDEKEEMLARQNAEAMKALGAGFIPPPKKPFRNSGTGGEKP